MDRQVSITGYAVSETEQKTQYEYDNADRITKVTYPDGNEITYGYNAAGKVIEREDQRGIVTAYSYDGVYNMTQKLVDGKGVVLDANETFTHDGLGRTLTAEKEVDSSTVSESIFAYNDFGMIAEANDTYFEDTAKITEYTYDQAGHANSVKYPTGVTVYITPDWQGRLDAVNFGAPTNKIVTYKYIGPRVAQRKYTSVNVTYEPQYDNLGRITSADSGASYAKFDYEYDPNSYNIGKQKYDHRTNDPCTEFSYDNLDRLTIAGYGIDESNEVFTMDDLGNRDMVNVRDGNDVNYIIDYLTNRYSKVGDANITYDQAGSLAVDKDGYGYEYDYENRIVEINDVNGTTVAEFAYDALGRRIEKKDSIAGTTTHYYCNDKWQVLCEYVDGAPRMFVYGNYIDEVLLMYTGAYIYYAHDHLYSPVALVYTGGVVLERYEYDAYGNCHVLEPNFAADPDGKSDYGNPYLFTGRRVDILDNGFLKIQYNRNRYYDYYTGRWTIHDPIGMRPTGAISPLTSALLAPPVQYYYGMNLYEYLSSNPANAGDPLGLWGWYVHYARTRDWVKGTNLWCHADDIARWNYSMDKGLNNPPLAWAITTVADIIATVKGWFFMMPITDAYMRHIAYLHFPGADLGMPVGPGLWPAWREVHKGIKLCDLEVFGKGLHQLQDSYSHQSNGRLPPWYGRNMVGHSRDRHGWNTEKWDDPKATGLRSGLIATARSIRGGTTLLKEWRMIVVAVSSDADIPSRSAAIGASYFRARLATMKAIDAFLDKCECVKEGPDAGKCLHCAKKKP